MRPSAGMERDLMTIGTNVDSWCVPCKLRHGHTIEAVNNGKIKRVRCNTCGARHAYRATPPGARTTANAIRKDEKGGRPNAYQAALRGRTGTGARGYATAGRFNVGDLVSHLVFGLGAVTGERENKIDVLFPDGPRVLVQVH